MRASMWLLALALVSGVPAAGAAEQSWVGTISDTQCTADHGGEIDVKECTLKCTGAGDKFVLMIDGGTKPMQIANQDFADLKSHAGDTVRVTGELKDGAIVVSGISGK